MNLAPPIRVEAGVVRPEKSKEGTMVMTKAATREAIWVWVKVEIKQAYAGAYNDIEHRPGNQGRETALKGDVEQESDHPEKDNEGYCRNHNVGDLLAPEEFKPGHGA